MRSGFTRPRPARRRGYSMALVEGRRVRVVWHRGCPGYRVRWSDTCSGCTEYSEGHLRTGPNGCDECGHTGRRRREAWLPFYFCGGCLTPRKRPAGPGARCIHCRHTTAATDTTDAQPPEGA